MCDVHSGEVLQTLEAHTDYVISAAFSPDGKVFASGWIGMKITVFFACGMCAPESFFASFPSTRTACGGGNILTGWEEAFITGGWRSGIRVWDVRTGELLHTLIESIGERFPNTSIAFSPDGNTFASGSQRLDRFVCGIPRLVKCCIR